MPKFGEGNMIIIADAAFPTLSHDGIDTIPMSVSSIEALKDVIASASAYGHIRPAVWVDHELMQLTDAQVPGIEKFRSRLHEVVGSDQINSNRSQSQLRSRVVKVADVHRVIVIKTPNRLPFSSIYVEFDNANWSAQQDSQLHPPTGK